MQELITSVSLLLLLHACTEVTAVKQKRFGIERCKRHCARYNRCYGIRYNITSITCTILNDRHTDGDDMHLSRKEILQSLRQEADCVASQYYRTRLCIVNNKGDTIDIAETSVSLKEALQGPDVWNISSKHNVVCRNKLYPLETWDFLPGRRYLNQMRFYPNHFRSLSEVKLLTLSMTNTSDVDFNHVTCNITYTETNRNLSVYYYGHGGSVTKVNVDPNSIEVVRFVIDRSSSGNFLHDIDMHCSIVRGSIELPNMNMPVRIALHLYLPKKRKFPSPKIRLRW